MANPTSAPRSLSSASVRFQNVAPKSVIGSKNPPPGYIRQDKGQQHQRKRNIVLTMKVQDDLISTRPPDPKQPCILPKIIRQGRHPVLLRPILEYMMRITQ